MPFEILLVEDAEREIEDIYRYIAEYREVHLNPYRILYRVFESRVVVYCVPDGRRDMQSILQVRLLR